MLGKLDCVPESAGLVGVEPHPDRACRSVEEPAFFTSQYFQLVLGFALFTQLDANDGLALLVAASTIISIGIAPASTLGTNLIVGSAPAGSAGAASGVAQTGNELGGALGIALLGTLGTAIYRNEVSAAIPGDVPHEAAASAHDTLGGAVAVAGQLPPGLLEAANGAFASGLHAAAAVCMVAMLAAAGITARFGAGWALQASQSRRALFPGPFSSCGERGLRSIALRAR